MTTKAVLLLVLFAISFVVQAQMPGLSAEALQLQQLIEKSEQQLQAARDMLKQAKQDARTLQDVSHSLEKLSAGIDQSIQEYQGTHAYQQALLESESETHRLDKKPLSKEKEAARFFKFQSDSIRANLSDLEEIKKIEAALRTAGQGFVPKLAGQAQLGSWQSNARISSQLTELLAALHDLSQKLDAGDKPGTLEVLLQGSDIQNKKQKGVMVDVGR